MCEEFLVSFVFKTRKMFNFSNESQVVDRSLDKANFKSSGIASCHMDYKYGCYCNHWTYRLFSICNL